jgi:hypothetical protein
MYAVGNKSWGSPFIQTFNVFYAHKNIYILLKINPPALHALCNYFHSVYNKFLEPSRRFTLKLHFDVCTWFWWLWQLYCSQLFKSIETVLCVLCWSNVSFLHHLQNYIASSLILLWITFFCIAFLLISFYWMSVL